MKKIIVTNDNWQDWKEMHFTTAVKAATYIKKNNMDKYSIYFRMEHIDGKENDHLVMWKESDKFIIIQGYAIPKVLTDLVRWKGGEQNEQKER